MNRRERRAGLAFARRTRDEWHPFERVDVHNQSPIKTFEHIARVGNLLECWRNNIYAVMAYGRRHPSGEHLQLAIRRHDGAEVHGWDDLQRIKDEVVGEERVAIEIYPAADAVMDEANMRHLFVLPRGVAAPFDLRGRWE